MAKAQESAAVEAAQVVQDPPLPARGYSCWTCDACQWVTYGRPAVICRAHPPRMTDQGSFMEIQIKDGTTYWCREYQRTWREVPPLPQPQQQ